MNAGNAIDRKVMFYQIALANAERRIKRLKNALGAEATLTLLRGFYAQEREARRRLTQAEGLKARFLSGETVYHQELHIPGSRRAKR